MTSNNNLKNVLLGIALVLLTVVPFGLDSFHTELVAKILIFAIFAMSLDLLIGFTGLISFGHAAYFGLAAYTVALYTATAEETNLFITLFMSMAAAATAALLVGLFVLRTKGIYFIMVTLAFAQMMYFIFHDTKIGGGSDGVYVNAKPLAASMALASAMSVSVSPLAKVQATGNAVVCAPPNNSCKGTLKRLACASSKAVSSAHFAKRFPRADFCNTVMHLRILRGFMPSNMGPRWC